MGESIKNPEAKNVRNKRRGGGQNLKFASMEIEGDGCFVSAIVCIYITGSFSLGLRHTVFGLDICLRERVSLSSYLFLSLSL